MNQKLKKQFVTWLLFLIAAVSAILFVMPTVLTITNSFMSEQEINTNYGAMIESASQDKKNYISEELNLKFIPDMISFQQYLSVLFKKSGLSF